MDEDRMVALIARMMGVDPYKVRMAMSLGSKTMADLAGDARRSMRPSSALPDADRPPIREMPKGGWVNPPEPRVGPGDWTGIKPEELERQRQEVAKRIKEQGNG